MAAVAALVLAVSAGLQRGRRRAFRQSGGATGPAADLDHAVFSSPDSAPMSVGSVEALDRLRLRVEAWETAKRSSAPPVPVAPGPRRRIRAFNRTLRLARRHRPPSSEGGTEPMIRVLGRVRVNGFGAPLTSQQQALVAMLGLRGPCGRDQLIDRLWGGRAVSTSRFANLLADVRAVIGRDRLVQNPDGRYELLDVLVDVERFSDLVQRADVSSESPDDPGVQAALDQLELAIGLIEGPILDSGDRRFWGWVDDGYHRRYEIEQLVVSAGLRAAVLALGVHQPQRARWACERCLSAVAHDERLVATLAQIHLVQGRHGAAAELVAGWEQAVRRLGLGEPSPGPRNLLLTAPQGFGDGAVNGLRPSHLETR